jgi:signal transduction histidine kinase
LGQHIRLLIPRPYLREHDTYRNPSDPDTTLGREVIGRQRDGRSIPLELSVGASASKQRLYVAIVRDVSQRKESEAALQDSRQQLRSLAARLQNIREEERTRISREVHDELGQALTGVKMDLAWLLSKMNDEALKQRARSGLELIDQTIQTVRKIASELRPAVLDNLGLVAAIEWQAHEFHLRTGILCACALELEQLELAADVSTTLFRIFQETLTNVMRHAQATRVEVSLRQQDQEVWLEVNDNGRGITVEQQAGSGSLGLLGMRERAEQLGGHFSIQGIPGQGTSVSLRVPLRLAPAGPLSAL